MEKYTQNGNPCDDEVCQAEHLQNLSRSSSAEDLQVFKNSKLFVIMRQNTSEQVIIDEIKMCLQNGADINAQNRRGNTMLHIAVKKHYQSLLEFLLMQYGVRQDIQNCFGLTAFSLAKPNLSLSKQLTGTPGNSSLSLQQIAHPPGEDFLMSDNYIDIDEGFVAPLSMKLKIDNSLKLSHDSYITALQTFTKDIHSRREKLDMDPYPSAATLAQFALHVYSDCVCEGDLQLPDGWRLLTTACNTGWSNGYVGAAYWNPVQQLVVVAHRGTVLNDLGSIWTNVKSILWNKYAPRINSAITFTEKIASSLIQLNKAHNWCFRLSITGHSLGGWLAQVTTFAVKYLRVKNSVFTKIQDGRDGLHAHTVAFDSPGCKSMLSKLKNDFDRRHDKSMFLRRLDITCFLSAPNRINSCNLHEGNLYRVITDFSDMNIIEKNTVAYTLAVHRMEKILRALEGVPDIYEMRDWPLSGPCRGRELKRFFEEGKHKNSYHAETEELQGYRYNFKKFHGDSCSLRVFSEDELVLIDRWVALHESNVKLTRMEKFAIQLEFEDLHDLFGQFVIDKEKQHIISETKDSLHRTVRHIKQVMRWFPAEATSAIQEQMALVPSAAESIYRVESLNYLNSLAKSHVSFKDSIGLKDFLESSAQRVLCISSPDSGFEATRLHNIYGQIKEAWKINIGNSQILSKYFNAKCQTFLEWGQFLKLEKLLNIQGVLKSNFTFDNLLIIEYKYRPGVTQCDINLLKHVLDNLKNSSVKKFIFISSSQNSLSKHLNFLSSELIVRKVDITDVMFSDLTEEAQKLLYRKKNIVLQGDALSLQHFAPFDLLMLNHLVDAEKFKIIVTKINPLLNIGSELPNLCDLEVSHARLNIDTSIEKAQSILSNFKGIINRSTHFVISGLSEKTGRAGGWERLRSRRGMAERIVTAEFAEHGALLFKQMCHKNTNNIIYWLDVTPGLVKWEQIYDRDFYIKRKFSCRIVVDLKIKNKLLQSRDAYDIFVFGNIESKSLLTNFFGISKEDDCNVFMKNGNIEISSSDKEDEDIIARNYGKPVHFLTVEESGGPCLVWRRSVGSLDGLRQYASTDISHSIDEQELCDRRSRVVIIADEPGMGKSTSLTSLSWLIKSSWVIRIDLKYFQTPIKNLPSELSVDSVAQFLLSENSDTLEYGLLKHCLESVTCRKVFVLFDGFDEIKEEYSGRITRKCAQEKVIKLLKFLKDKTCSVIFVTTREYPSKMLENELSVFATKFERIGKNVQQEFLVKFWRSHLVLEIEGYGEVEDGRLQQYAERLYAEVEGILGTNITTFMGIPLQMRMLAEISLQQAKTFVESFEAASEPVNLYIDSIYDLYRVFIDKKYDIYLNDKSGLSAGLTKVNKAWLERELTEKHGILGFQLIFPDEEDNYLECKNEHDEVIEVNRVGLIQINGDGDVEFIHKTFAEYYTADLVVHWLQKSQGPLYNRYPPAEELLVSRILLGADCRILRLFISEQFGKNQQLPTSANTLIINDLWLHKKKIFVNKLYQTALHVAVQEQNVCIIKFLLSVLPADFVAARDMEGDTALYLAAKKRSHQTIRMFLDTLQTCSIKAIRHVISATVFRVMDDESNLRYLMSYFSSNEYDSKLNTEWNSIYGKTTQISPFLQAVRNNELDTIKRHLEDENERHYLLMATNSKGHTALHIAAKTNNDSMAMYLGQSLSAEIDVIDGEGKTPLQMAAKGGKIETVKKLVELGANIMHRDVYGMSVLAWSAKYGHLSTVKYLVGCGADSNDADRNSITPLQHAAKGGRLEVVEYLAREEADIHVSDKYGMNSLSWAARAGHLSVVEFLLQKRVDIDSRDRYSMTVLQIAIKASQWKVARCLIHRGADVNIADWNGVTALQRAMRAGKWDIVQELLVSGSNVNVLDICGKSPLQLAIKSRKWLIAKYMLEKGANFGHISGEEKKELLQFFITNSDKKNFYELIRLGSIELLTMFIRQLGSLDNSNIESLQESYIDLKLKNVPLSQNMQMTVEYTILETQFFYQRGIETIQEVKSESIPLEDVKLRIKTIRQYVDALCTQYSSRDVDDEFIFLGRSLARELHILQDQQKETHHALPWEEVLFCLMVFISSNIQKNVSVAIYKLVLGKKKILSYLNNFSTRLCQIYLQENKWQDIMSSNCDVTVEIIPANDSLTILYEDYKIIKNIYGLKRILKYLNVALSADIHELGDTGMLVIQRALYVLSEFLKDSSDSLDLHRAFNNLQSLRDLLKHPQILTAKSRLKLFQQKDFFYILQQDLRKAETVIFVKLRNCTLRAVETFCDKIIKSEDLEDIKSICRDLHYQDLKEIDNVLSSAVDMEKLWRLLKQLEEELGSKSEEETENVFKIKNIVKLQQSRVWSFHPSGWTSCIYHLSIFVSLILNDDLCSNDNDLLKHIKACQIFLTKMRSSMKEIIPLLEDISSNFVDRRSIIKINAICSRILDIISLVETRKEFQDLNASSLRPDAMIYYEDTENDILFRVENYLDSVDDRKKLRLEIDSKKKHFEKKIKLISMCNNKGNIDRFIPLLKEMTLKEKEFDKVIKNYEESNFNACVSQINVLKTEYENFASSLNKGQIFPYEALETLFASLNLENRLKSKINDAIKYLKNDTIQQDYDQRLSLLANMLKCDRNEMFHRMADDHKRVAVEQLLLDLTDILENSQLFADSTFYDEYSLVLIGSNLRNYLAHGDLLVDISPFDPFISIVFSASIFIEKGKELVLRKDVLIGKPTLLEKNTKLKDRFTKYRSVVRKQSDMFNAAKSDNVELVKTCIGQGADINGRDFLGRTGLHYSAQRNSLKTFAFFLQHSAIKEKDKCHQTPIQMAFMCGCIKTVKFLQENKHIDIHYDNIHDLLCLAAENGKNNLIEEILRERSYLGLEKINNYKPLLCAIPNGHIEVIKTLLTFGLNIETNINNDVTPLHLATVYGNKEAVTVLLESGVEVDAVLRNNWTALCVASFNGFMDIVRVLLARGANIDAPSHNGMTPLHMALQERQEDTASVLIQQNADIHIKDEDGRSALHYAANGLERIVLKLIDMEVNVDDLTVNKWTALHIAAENGHDRIVTALLSKQANINSQTLGKKTALHLATRNSHERVVDILLQKGANVNDITNDGWTALHMAAVNGNDSIVRILIENNALINSLTKNNCTPLHLAASKGHAHVVQILLEKRANVGCLGGDMTALQIAVWNGHRNIVFILLENQSAVDDHSEENGKALYLAAKRGYRDIVDLLINKGKANVNALVKNYAVPLHSAAPSSYTNALLGNIAGDDTGSSDECCTPMFAAAENGHMDVLSILLNKNGRVDAVCTKGWTVLHVAAFNGHQHAVTALLRYKIDTEATNVEGNTALYLAASNGHDDVVKVLLETGADVDSINEDNCTALHVAAQRGFCDVVCVLLKYKPNIFSLAKNNMTALHFAVLSGNLNITHALIRRLENLESEHLMTKFINLPANSGRTSLHMAAENGHKEVVLLLLNKGACVDSLTEQKWSALHYAASNGHKDIVKILLEQGVQVDLKTNKNTTALHFAALEGSVDVVEELLKCGADIMSKTEKKNTALHLAVLNRQRRTVKVLLNNAKEKGEEILKRFVNSQDVDDWTTLHLAARNGDRVSVSVLLQNMADIDSADKHGWTALHVAAMYGHEYIVTQLLEAGADVCAEIDDKATPLHLAASEGFKNVIICILNFVKKKKPKILKNILNHLDKDNLTAMQLAVRNSKLHVGWDWVQLVSSNEAVLCE